LATIPPRAGPQELEFTPPLAADGITLRQRASILFAAPTFNFHIRCIRAFGANAARFKVDMLPIFASAPVVAGAPVFGEAGELRCADFAHYGVKFAAFRKNGVTRHYRCCRGVGETIGGRVDAIFSQFSGAKVDANPGNHGCQDDHT
jgi:hypothetical protein